MVQKRVLDHLTLVVSDYERSKAFYLAALAPLGCESIMELSRDAIPQLPVEKTIGLGVNGKPSLWLRPSEEGATPTHIAFHTPDRRVVDAFHKAAIAAGGRDHGEPGLRPHYHAHYYGAFVLDRKSSFGCCGSHLQEGLPLSLYDDSELGE